MLLLLACVRACVLVLMIFCSADLTPLNHFFLLFLRQIPTALDPQFWT